MEGIGASVACGLGQIKVQDGHLGLQKLGTYASCMQMGELSDGTKPGNGNFLNSGAIVDPLSSSETLQVDSCCRHSGRKQRWDN